MPAHRLAVYTFNQFVAPFQSDAIKGFRDAEPGAFAAIENANGFFARSGYDGEEGPESWGLQVFPKCWQNLNGDGWAPSTLSLWDSMEALMAATYHGDHGDAYRQGHKWHIKANHIPEYVLWWVSDGHRPDWSEAVARFENLIAAGPNAQAFSFKQAFAPNGQRIKPDTARIKALAALNRTLSTSA
ncbi:DUF3291 domain-containing protein [Labrenzia sp. PHM005]|uniref:DUF3291 domain-containing protein n=1 Tax=Labrenzia sp. PHM005 TaxID=2590016 RepID=UPI00114045BD|nr:DUF3291 domain-containing protein [Labrenzia sp. PHM005]QDG79237.1 DUF3291 domain-containing protein [Labrenzia sp. PHM005]